MTTPSTERKAGPLLGTGAQTTWPFTFKVFAATDIAVTIANSLGVETSLVYGVDYTVTLNANQETSPGGTVTYPISGSPLPVGSRLVILGNLPYDQPLDLPSGGNFSPLALENQLDRLAMQIQQLREQVGRAVQVSVTTGANVGLPAPSANELIGWDSTGNNLQNFALSELATAVAYATMRYDTFTGDGVETQFTLTADPVTLANLDVAISGVTQVPGTDYSLLNGVLVFTSAPANGTEILARYGEGLVNVGGDSSDIRFLPAGTGAEERTVENKLRDVASATDFGAVGDGVTDNAVAFAAITAAAQAGKVIYFPKPAVAYATSVPLNFTAPATLIADPDTRIKLTASANYVVQFDYTNGGAFFDHGGKLENFVLDGDGLAVDGLSLKAVVSADFPNIRVTNVTRAGLHLWWAQLCNFTNFTCSDNIEPFTTTPVHGVLVDTASSSANTFVNICIEHVSGSGVEAISLINSLFLNGTSEGNAVGLVFGEAVVGPLTSIGNVVVLMDLEVNSSGDVHLLRTASNNSFYGLAAGYLSGSSLINGGDNKFYGGLIGSVNFGTTSARNVLSNINFIGAGVSLTDDGVNNTWTDIFNISTAQTTAAKGSGRGNVVLSNGQTATLDASRYGYYVVSCTGATATIAAPTNPKDGQELVVTIHNISGGALTLTWSPSFKTNGWVTPATGFNRSITFRYDTNYGSIWYPVSMSQTDVVN